MSPKLFCLSQRSLGNHATSHARDAMALRSREETACAVGTGKPPCWEHRVGQQRV